MLGQVIVFEPAPRVAVILAGALGIGVAPAAALIELGPVLL